jgi:uncharacterized protein YigE (DUF2233 family)
MRALTILPRLAALALVALMLAPSGARAQEPCRNVTFADSEFSVCSFDLRRYRIDTVLRAPDGQPYGSLDKLTRAPEGAALVAAMNAGMYQPDLSPAGLYVEKGRMLKPANTAGGHGNFHLKPNGVFYVAGERAGVLETGAYLRSKTSADSATQSGPMLVINGRIHPKISDHGVSRKIRNGVGVRDGRTVVFAISNRPVTFGEFARLFRDELGCPNALFLDGSISSLYAPSISRRDGFWPVGPILAASRRT